MPTKGIFPGNCRKSFEKERLVTDTIAQASCPEITILPPDNNGAVQADEIDAIIEIIASISRRILTNGGPDSNLENRN